MIQNRKKLYAKLEELRGNPLIVYVTSIRAGVNSQMGNDSISEIIKQIYLIPKEKKEVDFLIISNGGDPICSLRIINVLREKFKKINILVPYVAYSAATLLALGADDIVMHPYSNLGPVDPQMIQTQQLPNGQTITKAFAAEDLKHYFSFVKNDVGITDQNALASVFNVLTNEVSPTAIGAAKRSNQLSVSLSEKLLSSHMKDANKASTISKALMSSFYHHGYAVSRSEAKQIGLNIVEPNEEVEDILWEIWKDFEKEMGANKLFNPQNELNSIDDYKKYISSSEFSQRVFKINVFIGSIESLRAISRNENEIELICVKNQQGLTCSPIEHIKGWVYHKL